MAESDEAGAVSPYDGKTIAEIVHDYAVVRGDLTEQYARDQLVSIIEGRLVLAAREVLDRQVPFVSLSCWTPDQEAAAIIAHGAAQMTMKNHLRDLLACPAPDGQR